MRKFTKKRQIDTIRKFYEYRERNSLKQKEIARMIDLSPNSLSNAKTGKLRVSYKALLLIELHLEVERLKIELNLTNF